MSKLGFVILAHENLDRVAQTIKHLRKFRCPVAVHVDAKIPHLEYEKLANRFKKDKKVTFIERGNCEWGRYSLVEAMLRGCEDMLALQKNLGHIYLISGSCIPLQPIDKLIGFLGRNKATDFIESVKVERDAWGSGGLLEERFRYFFPFSWRRQRKIFDLSIKVQNLLGINRHIPIGIDPYVGSQWWCLTRRTVEKILNDPGRAQCERYFRMSWIPDESFFQTMARRHSERIESRSLTFAKFDRQGKPFTFYDDHAELLKFTDCFFARKIWPKANGLYETYLGDSPPRPSGSRQKTIDLIAYLDEAIEQRRHGGAGRFNMGRFPTGREARKQITAAPYQVFVGLDLLFADFNAWLETHSETVAHGRIFRRRAVEFREDQEFLAGNLPNYPRIRNRNPRSFLSNFIWAAEGKKTGFHFGLDDSHRARKIILGDKNSTIFFIRNGWLLAYLAARETGEDTISNARRLKRLEDDFLAENKLLSSESEIRVFDLHEVIANPGDLLRDVLAWQNPSTNPRAMSLPSIRDIEGIAEIARFLRNQGIDVDFTLVDPDKKQKAGKPGLKVVK